MGDNDSDGLIDIADLDPRIMPMFKTSPERIGLAIGDELEDWNSEFHDCDEVTWYSGEPPVQVSIGYVRADLYESLQSQLAAANERADAAQSQLPVNMADCTITYHQCDKGHGWLSATNWVKHGCFICERNAAVKALEDAREQLADADNLIADWKPHMYCEHGVLRTYECEQCEAPVPAQPAVVPEGLANAVLANIAAIAHCGGLAKLDNENALSNIRQLSKPWCDNTGTLRDLKNRVDAAILSATEGRKDD